MANKRMFNMKIVDSDAFLDMPLSSQCLYFHLNMRADDDGFVGNPKRIMRTVGCSEDDLKLLIAKRFVLCFEDGVIVIKHWRMHNCIQKDRYTPTVYQEEKSMLYVKNNKSYTLDPEKSINSIDGNKSETKCIQNVSPDIDIDLDKDIDIDKDIDKEKDNKAISISSEIDIDSVSDETHPPKEKPHKKDKPVKHKYGEYNNVLLTDEELSKLKTKFPDWENRIENLSLYIESKGAKYKSHYATILAWDRRDTEQRQKTSGNGQYRPQTGYKKTGTAEELDEFYKMVAEWAESDDK